MPFGLSDLFWIGAVPCVAAIALMLGCRRWLVRPAAAWAVCVAGGLLVGMIVQNLRAGGPAALETLLHPRTAIDWLPWLVLVAAGIQLLAAYVPRAWQRGLAVVAGVCAIAVPLCLWGSNALAMRRWSPGEKLAAVVLWSAVVAMLWLTLAQGRRNGQPLVRSLLLLVVTLGVSVTLAASGAFVLGELGGVTAAALLGAVGSAGVLREMEDGPSGAAGPLAVMLGGLILVGYANHLAAVNAVLLIISLAAAAGWLPTGWLRDPGGRAALRTALALTPLALAVVSAVLGAMADQYG